MLFDITTIDFELALEHVYVHDAFVSHMNESQAHALKPLIDEGFVTYVDWSHRVFPRSLDNTQHSAYQHRIDRFGHESLWQATMTTMDMDEYPFSPSLQISNQNSYREL